MVTIKQLESAAGDATFGMVLCSALGAVSSTLAAETWPHPGGIVFAVFMFAFAAMLKRRKAALRREIEHREYIRDHGGLP